MSSASRAAQLSAQDEDSLLSLQADFEARKLSPSASMLKKKKEDGKGEGKEDDERKASSASSAPAASQREGKPGPAAAIQPPLPQQPSAPQRQQQQHPNQPFELVGEVVERRRAGISAKNDNSSGSNSSTLTPTPTAGGFPAATHRRQSKFSLARKSATASSPAASSPPAPRPLGADEDPLKGECGDASAIISTMTPEELAEAKAEAEARLPTAAVEFLRRRGRERQQQQREQRGEQAPSSSSSSSAAAAAEAAPPCLEALELNSTGAPCFPSPPPLLERKATAAQKEKKKKKKKKDKNDAAPASANQRRPPAAASSRLRFDFDSACPVLPLAGPDERPSAALLRDPLRSEKKEIGEENAYTLSEAAALARSAVPAQRLAAVDLMTRVARKVVGLKEAGDGAAPVFPAVAAASAAAAAAEVDASTSSSSPPPLLHLSITWDQVHLNLLRTAPLALRNALDDGHPPVVAAAAAGLALLVDEGGEDGDKDGKSTSPSFAASLAAASIYPLTGSPALASAPATRPHAVGAWVRQGIANDDDESHEGGDDNDDDDKEGGIGSPAAGSSDPVAGLLRTAGFLERASAVLAARSSHRAYAAATLPLVKLLRAAAAAGGVAAAAVAGSGSAVAALVDVAGLGEGDGGGEGRQASVNLSSSSWDSVRARAAALDAISLLCAAAAAGDVESGASEDEATTSTTTASALAAAGVGSVVSSTLLVSSAAFSTACSSSPPPSSRGVNSLLLASSLRAWRALMGCGVPCIRLDDAFATLRFLFDDDDDGGGGNVEEERGQDSSLSYLFSAASAEALAAAAAAISAREEACCSRGGAAAVAAQVLSWATSKEALGRAAGAAMAADESESSSSPPAVASAAASLTRLAAAWRLLSVAEGEKLLESGRLQAAVAGCDFEPLVEDAARAAATALFDKSSGDSSSTSSSSSSSSSSGKNSAGVAVACCELLAALVGLYRCCYNLSLPPWLSPRVLTSRRSALGTGAVAAAAAGAAAAARVSAASSTTAATSTATSWTRADAALHQARRHALQLIAVIGFEAAEDERQERERNGTSSSVPLAVLHLAPPGTEATIALPALAAFLSSSSLAPILSLADDAVEKLAAATAETSPLAASAGRFGSWERLTTTTGGKDCDSGADDDVPAAAVEAFSKAALRDYAATWLGMMVEKDKEQAKKKESAAGAGAGGAAAALYRPFRLADLAGSRLPLPPWGFSTFASCSSSWVLADVCPRGVASAREASEAVGRALTLALALLLKKTSSSSSSLSTTFSTPPLDLSSLAASVADLLLGGDSGVVRGDSEAWRNPRARWAVAALSEESRGRARRKEGEKGESGESGDDTVGASASSSAASAKITPARATGWASSWASDTFGDPLCGGLVAAAALLSGNLCDGGGGGGGVSSSASASAIAAFDLLEESDALSSLPPWEGAVFVPSNPSKPSFRLPTQLASRAVNALATGRLDRAIEAGEEDEEGGGTAPPSPSLALSDALGWLREQCLAVVGGERQGGDFAFPPPPPPPLPPPGSAADPATTAAAALRHFLAQARPKHVAALVRSCDHGGDGSEGKRSKIDRMQALQALRSASGGNEALENKVKEAEKMLL